MDKRQKRREQILREMAGIERMKNDRIDKVFAEAHRNLPHQGPRRQSADREFNDFRTHASRIT